MGCRVCCCCSPRSGARLVGILDLILGIVGIACVGLLLIQGEQKEEVHEPLPNPSMSMVNQSKEYDYEEAQILALGLVVPSLMTLFTGLTILISVGKNHVCTGRLAYVLNILLVICLVGDFVILFITGVHWIMISPLLLLALIQGFLLCDVQNFIRNELSIETV